MQQNQHIEKHSKRIPIDLFKKRVRSCKTIHKTLKRKLIQLVKEGHKITDAACMLGINYSSAKTIIYNTRIIKNLGQEQIQDEKECFFERRKNSQDFNVIEVITTIFGTYEHSYLLKQGNIVEIKKGEDEHSKDKDH